jgi:hypothetical protein
VHDGQFLPRPHVITVHRDIDDAGVDISCLHLANESRDSARELHAA